MSSKLLKQILKNKIKSNYKIYKYTITPSYEDFQTFEAIYETRLHGVPINCLYDTSDKIVLNINNIYNNNLLTSEKNNILIIIGKELNKLKYKVWLIDNKIYDKGYYENDIHIIDNYTSINYLNKKYKFFNKNNLTISLYIFNITIKNINKIINNINVDNLKCKKCNLIFKSCNLLFKHLNNNIKHQI
jgi:hypothetical protein